MLNSHPQTYTNAGSAVQFTKGERPFSIRQSGDAASTSSAQSAGLADYERQYLAGLLASVAVRQLADLIMVRDGIVTIRADIPLHTLSLEDACTLQGLAGGGILPVPPVVAEPAPTRRGRRPAPANLLSMLTERQRDVLALLCAGKSNHEIAAALDLSEGTAKIHVSAILKAMGATNRTHAVMLTQQLLADGEV